MDHLGIFYLKKTKKVDLTTARSPNLTLPGMHRIYPLVNVHIAMENHQFYWENSLTLWAMASIAMSVMTGG